MKPSGIAIIGMAGRFPGARNIAQFWENLRDGVESIRTLSDEELLAAGVSLEDFTRPDYVKRASALDDVPMFDAAFFGISPRDASIMDPQHRHFLECAWQALEDAAHPPQHFDGSIGVFAGSGMNSYLIHNLLANRKLLTEAGLFQLKQTGNDKDVLATRVSYQFDLRGPSINVQTACSTSLVAVNLACQSLLNHECDMALAGGVTIEIPHGQGYLYREGEILSRDGHCRAFDAESTGTVFASGVGVVVLRRLEDAIADGDHIRAVILGSAINNDGARKVGYLAPSVEGQAEVIEEALAFADVTADDISYVEAHGTGTLVGDPIEVRALTQAFRRSTQRAGYCAIGSLKSNVGHLDAAAGVASLIKTVLALEHAQMPASLHFKHANPHIEFQGSPFFVNGSLRDWPSNGTARRAGVTSLGIGGTNVHLVLEEAPVEAGARPERPYYLFPVSAKTEGALERATTNLADYLDAHPESNLRDAAWTCQVGRRAFPWRRALVASNSRGDMNVSADGSTKTAVASQSTLQIVFMFPGQGSQYVNMGRELYENEKIFRQSLDRCAEYLTERLGVDVRKILYPTEPDEPAAAAQLNQTGIAQPALFAVEYAMAQWWMALGIKPAAMVGHSIGEYVAACIAGVFTLEDALTIVAERGRLMQSLPGGAMLAVSVAAAQVPLSGNLSLAAVNSPGQCVISGPTDEIVRLEQDLALQSIACRRLATSHAFHSAMMEPIVAEFERRLRTVTYRPPRIPYLSNLTGTWITAEEAINPTYWARHLRNTVRFGDCLAELANMPGQLLLEVGPGNALCGLARNSDGTLNAFQSMPHSRETTSGLCCALQALGEVWTRGVEVDWAKLYASEQPRRMSLPAYPFEHREFWIDPDPLLPVAIAEQTQQQEGRNSAKSGELLLYERVWQRMGEAPASAHESCCWLIFKDGLGVSDQIAAKLTILGDQVVLVDAAMSYTRNNGASYTISPARREDYDALMAALLESSLRPKRVLHLWSVCDLEGEPEVDAATDLSFFSPLYLAQALAAYGLTEADLSFISNNMQQVFSESALKPERSVLLGVARVAPLELAGISCRSIDVEFAEGETNKCADEILAAVLAPRDGQTIAIRSGTRFVETVRPIALPEAPAMDGIERGGVYILTGGTGGIGLILAEHLAREFQARLVLVSRKTLPPQDQWGALIGDENSSDAEKALLRKLVEIEAEAGGMLTVEGDVTDLGQMQSMVALALQTFGRVDGVLHAAGVLEDAPLLLKTRESAVRVLAPKVRGTLVLEQALRDVPLRTFVLFSSISSIDPMEGQVDYAAANAFLDAFALSRQGPFKVINWGRWRDAGMGAGRRSNHPIQMQRILDSNEATVDASLLSPKMQWVLSEHAVRQDDELKPILPGTAAMEMAAAAFARPLEKSALEFRDVYFLAPLMMRMGEEREVRIQLRPIATQGAERSEHRFSVFSRVSEWVEHFSGIIANSPAPALEVIDRAAILARCGKHEIVFDEQHRTRQERHLAFGPRWRSLRNVWVGSNEALAEVRLDERFNDETSSYLMHPTLLDLATGAAFYLTNDYEHCGDLFLPFAYKRLRVYSPLPARLFSHIRARNQSGGRSEVETFDITLFDDAGKVLAEIEGFSARRITDPAKTLRADDAVSNQERAGGELLIETGERPGIDPLQAAREFVRIVSAKTPRAVIALGEALEAQKPRNAAPDVQAAELPDSRPAGREVEEVLARWWHEMLGVERAGLDDDFFDLGGHSLIAVRLLTKVKKVYRVDLDFDVLFEARTLRKLAGLIRAAQTASPETE